jgi:hypothetical protein
MSEKATFDIEAAHRYFSAGCFNLAWDLINKSERTPEENEQMLRLSLASHWHWTQRADCTQENVSIAYWQTSRVYAVLGQAENARRYARLCLEVSSGGDVPLWCLGYAYEALARTELVAGDLTSISEYLQEALSVAEAITDPETRQMLLADLETIK